jgi:hypothetical protein
LEDKLVQDQVGRLRHLGVKLKPLSAQEQEAVKDDDAEIPYHLWNSRLTRLWDSQLLPPSIEKPAEVLIQQCALGLWKMKVRRSFFAWFSNVYYFRVKHKKAAVWNGTKYSWNERHKSQYRHYWSSMWGHRENDQMKSLLAAADCIERAANSSWWDWEDGSRPLFWRWSVEYHKQIRHEIPLWYRGTAQRNFLSQSKEKDTEVRQSIGAKLMKVFVRRYFMYGMILSLTSFFYVPKGNTDVRLVYNGTSSGLNAHLWAPWFALPNICALLRALELDTFMTDSDIGEMFLNFMLEERCARLVGVDLTHYAERGEGALEGKRHLVQWGRCLMGGTFSPYQTGQ